VTIVARVESRGAHAARLLGGAAPLTRELVLGALRWQLTLDFLLAPHLRTSLAALDPAVRGALRVGLFEALRLDTPVPIAVAEAVRVARALAPRAAGLVNAVLRRAVTAPWPDPADESAPLATRFSHPAWLLRRWSRLLGDDALRRTLAANQTAAPLALLAAATDVTGLERAGCRLEPHPWVEGVLLVRQGTAAAVAALEAGAAYAMDPTAVLVARCLPVVDGPVVDLTAAPGGKSLVLAHERRLSRSVAGDRHVGRVAMMRRTLRGAPAGPAVFVGDAARPPLRPGAFAGVLLDAPCSGTGTLRRHPEIRWRLDAAQIDRLAAVQRELAAAACDLLAPGGVLLYATCSLEAEENEAVVRGLHLVPVPLGDLLPSVVPRIVLPGGGVLLPPTEWGDGFTVHALRRPA